MTAKYQNIEMWQGETTVLVIPVVDGSSAPVNLTGATAVIWRMYESINASSAAIEKTLGSGAELVNSAATNDAVKITLVKSDTADKTPRTYYHELRVVLGGDDQVVASGDLTLRRSRTL